MPKTKSVMSSIGPWLLAVRPRTLPASASGVVVGSAMAAYHGGFRLLPALASLAVSLCLQIASNLANDVFDFERGADAKRAHGPTRVTQAGLLSPRAVKTGLIVAIAIAAAIGALLAIDSGPVVIGIGGLAILASIAYSAGPFPLSYHGLGELFAFLFFGVAAVAGSYFVETGRASAAVFAVSLAPGCIIAAILVVNYLRDIEEDAEAGKRTLAVRFGVGFAKVEYLSCLALAFLLIPVAALAGILPWWSLASWLSLPLALGSARTMVKETGRSLNRALAGTGMLSLAFSLLFAAGILVAISI